MALRIENLAVDLGGHRIVEDVTLDAPTGSFVGLLGPNGSGKSTVLRTTYRIHTPTTGRVLIGDAHSWQDLLALPARAAALRLAVVAQDTSIEFDTTAGDIVRIGRHPHKRAFQSDDAADVAAVRDALEVVGCADLEHRSVHTLSGGERQRVLVARALAQGADHLLLDEPTNHLDIRYQAEVLDLLSAQARRGVTVLAALHDLSLAALHCDTVHLLSHGRLVASGTPAEVITSERIRAVYGADVLVVPHPETGTPHVVPRRPTPTPAPATHHQEMP